MNLDTPLLRAESRADATWLSVAPHQWISIARELLAHGFLRCEWLKGVHRNDDEFEIYLKVTRADLSDSVIVTTIIEHDVESITSIYPAADFHERECAQMLGVVFNSRESTDSAFNADFAGHPLRRDFALTPRVETVWPGQVDPEKAVKRRPALPPGVHKEWSHE